MWRISQARAVISILDLGEHALKVPPLINSTNLKTLKLVKNNLPSDAAIELFRVLQENMTITSLHLSENELTSEALDELIEMLNINITLRDIYLLDVKMSIDYKNKLAGLSNRFRKIYT